MITRSFAFSLLALLLFPGVSSAKDFVVEARVGAVQALLQSGQISGGDRVVLSAGRHGDVLVQNLRFTPAVSLVASPDGKVILDSLLIKDSSGFVVTGLVVLPTKFDAPHQALVTIEAGENILLEKLKISSAESSDGWSAADWVARAHSGVWLDGRDLTLRDSTIRIVDHGVQAIGDGARVERNMIEWFRGDGIRGLGDGSVYVGNTIQGCVDVDDNHDDGFQSWSLGADGRVGRGVVRDVLIAENTVRGGKLSGSLGCDLQGIGLFDGMFEGWVIRDNIIEVNHWHGITVMGARGVVVENNIVVDESDRPPGPPWVVITEHKDGRKASRSVVSGNVTMAKPRGGDPRFSQPQQGVKYIGNRVVKTAPEAFD